MTIAFRFPLPRRPSSSSAASAGTRSGTGFACASSPLPPSPLSVSGVLTSGVLGSSGGDSSGVADLRFARWVPPLLPSFASSARWVSPPPSVAAPRWISPVNSQTHAAASLNGWAC